MRVTDACNDRPLAAQGRAATSKVSRAHHVQLRRSGAGDERGEVGHAANTAVRLAATWAALGVELVVKHENHTPIGAFKVRGGLTYLDRLRRERAQVKGIVSATRGNHGQSLAFAGRHFGVPVAVVVPHGNSVEKNAAMRAFGAEIIEHGVDFDDAKQRAAEIAQERGYEFVPSFHPDLVVGVATYARELFEAYPDLDVVYAPIGLAPVSVG